MIRTWEKRHFPEVDKTVDDGNVKKTVEYENVDKTT